MKYLLCFNLILLCATGYAFELDVSPKQLGDGRCETFFKQLHFKENSTLTFGNSLVNDVATLGSLGWMFIENNIGKVEYEFRCKKT